MNGTMTHLVRQASVRPPPDAPDRIDELLPSWSHDGKRLAVLEWGRNATERLHVPLPYRADAEVTMETLPELSQLISDLTNPAAYPDPVTSVTVVQTHISCVFLTGEYAYKVKKPVDLGFLDYHTLEQRRYLCGEEIRLNRRLCPDLYLDAVPITRQCNGLRIGGTGPPIEWAVKMRQLRTAEMLSSRLEVETVDSDEIRRIATVLAEFHTRAGTNLEIREWGSHAVVARTVYNALRLMDELGVDLIPSKARASIRKRLKSLLYSERALLSQRLNHGCVRDCHGDLRTQNICLDDRFDGGIQVFDCIEFNEELRYIDVAADLAYLTMDLDLAGRADLRAMLVDAYSLARNDDGLRRTLEFYRIYRALVRGNIALLAAGEAEVPAPQRATQLDIAAAAYDLARCYAHKRARPALLITTGFSGSGKSWLAREVGRRIPAVVIASDSIRKAMAGLAPSVRLPEVWYAAAKQSAVYSELYRQASDHLARGEHVLLDATFLSNRERADAAELARLHAADFWTLECTCPDAIIRRRLEQRANTSSSSSDAGVHVYEQQRREHPDLRLHVDSPYTWRHLIVNTEQPAGEAARTVVDRFTETG